MKNTKEEEKKKTSKNENTKSNKTKPTSTTNQAKSNVKTTSKDTKNDRENLQENVTYIDAFSVIALILGGFSMFAWGYPLIGLSIGIPGLVLGLIARITSKTDTALIGFLMSLIGIIISIMNVAF